MHCAIYLQKVFVDVHMYIKLAEKYVAKFILREHIAFFNQLVCNFNFTFTFAVVQD